VTASTYRLCQIKTLGQPLSRLSSFCSSPQHALASNRTLCDLTASLIVILYQYLHQSSRNHQSRWTTRLVTCYDVQQRNNSVLTELVAYCLRDAFSTCVSSEHHRPYFNKTLRLLVGTRSQETRRCNFAEEGTLKRISSLSTA